MSDAEATSDVTALTVQLLSAYLANNTVASEDLAGLIRSTKAALTGAPSSDAPVAHEIFEPAVSIRKSLASPEHIISLIDGRPYKTLKRHLMARGLTPEAYRSRYNLPASYPMVAPAYADKRRAVAQELGLGRRRPNGADAASGGEASNTPSSGAEPQMVQKPSSASETKQDSVAVSKKRKGRPAKAASAKNLDTAAAQVLVSATEADRSSEAATLAIAEGTQTEAPSPAKGKAKPVAERRSGPPSETGPAARGKSKARPKPGSEPAAVVPDASPDTRRAETAAEPAAKRATRAKLGVFKKADTKRADTSKEGGAASPQAQSPVANVPATAPPAKRKTSKRATQEPRG